MGPRRLDYSELPYYPLPRYKDFCPMNSPVGNGQKPVSILKSDSVYSGSGERQT